MKQKQDFLTKMAHQLDTLSKKIKDLSKKSQDFQNEKKDEIENNLVDLKNKRKKLKQRLKKLKNSSEDALDEARIGAEKIWEDLKNTAENIISKFDGSSSKKPKSK